MAHLLRQVPAVAARIGQFVPKLGLPQAERPLPFKRKFARDHLKQHNGKGVDIRPVIDLLAVHLLRRHVHQRTGAGVFVIACPDHRSQPEVCQIRRTETIQQDIGRLEVSMHHVFRMSAFQRTGDRIPHLHNLGIRHRAMIDDAVQQRAAGDIAHHDVELALKLPEVIDRQDVRVFERRYGAGLHLKAGPHLLVAHIGHDRLDGNRALQAFIPRGPHVRHPAAPDVFHHRVLAEAIPDLHRQPSLLHTG